MKTAERYWFELARRLGMPVAQLKDCMPWTEYLCWRQLIDDEPNEFDPLHWYLAQIAFELFKIPFLVWGKKPPPEVGVKTFILKFEAAADPTKDRQLTDEEAYDKMLADSKKSRAAWMKAGGVGPDGKSLRNKSSRGATGMRKQVGPGKIPQRPPSTLDRPPRKGP